MVELVEAPCSEGAGRACRDRIPRKELDDWLDTDESKSVGQGDGELIDPDAEHMEKVVGYVHRHLEQMPGGDVEDTK